MTEKKNGAFVNLIRKAVGLPTGNESCCGFPTAAAPAKEEAGNSSCCGTSEPKKEKSGGSCCG